MKWLDRLLASLGMLALLGMSACSSSDRPAPAVLQPIAPQLVVETVWRSSESGVVFPLLPQVRAGKLALATGAGVVSLRQAATGDIQWRVDTGAEITAGPGTDGHAVAVVSRDNELLLLADGRIRWRLPLETRVVTAPLVAGERVFVVGVDRIVHAFDVLDGRRLWTLKRAGDPLTLAQTGVLTAYKDTLLVGHGARLLGVDPLKGQVRWEVLVSSPRGTNEVERLADLVGPAARDGASFCLRAFQSAVGCVDAERGALQWSASVGGVAPVAADAEMVFAADSADRVFARRRGRGDQVWLSEQLLYRSVSAPAVLGPAVLLGDLEGQVHWLSRATGQALARTATDGSPVVFQPVVVDDRALVVTSKGGLFMFQIR